MLSTLSAVRCLLEYGSLRNRVLSAALLATLLPVYTQAQSLKITFGGKGVQTLSYFGVTLEDTNANPGDSFHIWHMRATDLQGNLRNDGAYGWGETNNGESWDANSKTETYTFPWGAISTQFVQSGDNFDMIVTETNNNDSGIIFDGAEIYPFILHFPADPAGFYGYSQYAITTTGPGVSVADFGTGVVTNVLPDESVSMYAGWKSAGGSSYSPLMTTTPPDGLATFLPQVNRPVLPGSSFTYRVSLRFTPEGAAANASDAYTSFANTYPSQMTWADHRIIGTAYLASSPANTGNITQAGGFPSNPRRYFNDSSVDVTSVLGLQSFQDRMLAQANANVKNTQGMNGQGVITWDIEGEQYPQSTSYVCSPDQIALVAPEMESIVTDQSTGFAGQKLDDAYFATMTNAGLKVGLCLRPQVFTLASNGSASQVYLTTTAQIVSNLESKARYANSRWGATIFYVDSTVDTNGGTLDPAIFQQLITDLPSFLFIPEESTPRYYAYSAPFYSFLFHTDLGTASSVYQVYPNAFGANLVNDVSAATLATFTPQLTSAVSRGDILMGHADYWQANDPTLLAIYTSINKVTSPVKVAPNLTWASPASMPYGTPLSSAQLNASANVNGTFIYSPALGTVLPAGSNTLLASFVPSDTTQYTGASATVTIVIRQASPIVNWVTPAALTLGSSLSQGQLDATANVPGTFVYSPGPGTVLPLGNSTLTAVFSPADSTDYIPVTTIVNLTVQDSTPQKPILSWSNPSPIAYGQGLTSTQLNATANVPGSFAYSPGLGAMLTAGLNILQTSFTPSDTQSYASATASAVISVAKATPVISWPTPSPMTTNVPLSGQQLDASANVAGTFSYNPGFGATLPVGVSTLAVTFAPNDTTDYASQTVAVSVQVLQQPLGSSNLEIVYPANGATVSGTLIVGGNVNLFLDSAGTYLMVDGDEVGSRRVLDHPFVYTLDTTVLTNGLHNLQLWGHDISNNTTLSAIVTVIVANP